MKLAFTICSNNYLAQAKTLGDSLLTFNPEYDFYIILVDRISPEINYCDILHKIITIEEIVINEFDELWKKYNIIELNTCVKPSVFRFFFQRFPSLKYLFYFDPDILIYDKLSGIELEFNASDFILTPHILNPLEINELRPNEYDFLNFGIFNIGFLGLKHTKQILSEFLPWWEERTYKLGFIDPNIGLFVDQIWFNIVPLFYKKICILKNNGCNVAPWNLHERNLAEFSNKIIVNNKDNLIFFHFSSFKCSDPGTFFYNYDRNRNIVNSTIESLYSSYYRLLLKNGVEKLSTIKCYFVELKETYELNDMEAIEALQMPEKGNILPIQKIKKFILSLLPAFLFNQK